LKKNGSFVDPLAEHRKLPPGEPIPAASMVDFRAVRDGVLRQITTALVTADAPATHHALAAVASH
jgi:hypothetical protein